MQVPATDPLRVAIMNSLSPDAVRYLAARIAGDPEPEPQDNELEDVYREARWFATFLSGLA